MGVTRVKKTKKASKTAVQIVQVTEISQPQVVRLRLQESESSVSSEEAQESATPTSTSSNHSNKSFDNEEGEVVKEEEEQQQQQPYIEVRLTESRGYGVFAVRKIPAGALILSEPPLIRLTQAEEDLDKDSQSMPSSPSPTLSPIDHPDPLTRQFLALPKPLQKAYLKLHDAEKSSFSRVKSIYYSNCYNLSFPSSALILPSSSSSSSSPSFVPTTSDPGGSCIGLISSRINHSCVPNAQFSFRGQDKTFAASAGAGGPRMEFRALKPIPRGREVLGCYDAPFEGCRARHRRQTLYYGFRCACEACGGGGAFWYRSDDRRAAMVECVVLVGEWERRFAKAGGRGGLGDEEVVMAALERLEGLLVKEGLLGLPLADTYRGLARWEERREDWKAWRRWATRELEVCVICLGADAERVVRLRRRLEEGTRIQIGAGPI